MNIIAFNTDEIARPDMANETPIATSDRPSFVGSAIRKMLHTIPALLSFGLLILVGWWGHHSGWTLPKFSQLNGKVVAKDDWCSEHSVPESICVECDDSLLPKQGTTGWCKIHGIPDCTLCNPSLAQLKPVATVGPTDLAKAASSLEFAARIENNPICKTHQRRIQFTDEAAADKAGVVVVPAWAAPVVEFISAPGAIGYDQTRVAHLSSRAAGSVVQVFKRLGEPVHRGEVVALIDAAEVGKAKADLLQEYATLLLRKELLVSKQAAGNAVAESQLRIAGASVREAEIRMDAVRQTLVNFGFNIKATDLQDITIEQLKAKLHTLSVPADYLKSVNVEAMTSNLLPIVSPIDGVIVSRDVVDGEVVNTVRILFEIVDTRSLWLTFDVKAEDSRVVKQGQTVRFKPDGSKDELEGKLVWISTQSDPKTRTVKVRADLSDPYGKLRSNTYGTGRVILREEPEVLTVPNEAVQSEGCCQIVFVRDKDYLKPYAPKVFHVRKVRTGAKDATKTEIIAGVLPGELVVTSASGLLLTELLRGNLGEGCACHSK